MKKFLLLLNIFLCFALVFCIIQINDLENQVNHLRNSLNNVDRHLSNNISNIYQNVRDMLDEQDNQLTDKKILQLEEGEKAELRKYYVLSFLKNIIQMLLK